VNGKSYPMLEYIEALAITGGVAMFTFSQENGGEKKGRHSSENNNNEEFLIYGLVLITLYLLCDSFTSQWQSRVFKQFGLDSYQMMLGTNIWSMILTLCALIQANELFSSIDMLLMDSNAMTNMIILSITSATGQLFIFYTIKELGPIIFTIFMTTRQIVSLFLSCILFGHQLRPLSFLAAFFVFLIVSYRIYRKGSD
jgi:adenosine 3'-phospho 5'-phosphosulfate transporter B2